MAVEFSTTTVSSYSGIEIEGQFTRGTKFTQTVGVTFSDDPNGLKPISAIVITSSEDSLKSISTTFYICEKENSQCFSMSDEFLYK